MGKFSDWAKTHNLSQDAAQAAVDLAAEMQTSSAQAIMTAQKAAVTEFYAPIGGDPATWAAQARADKEIGGDKFNENLALAAQARDQFGTPELKKVLNVMKIGDHPEVLRFFVRAGKAISQDGFVPGRASNGARKSDAEVIYGSQTTH